MWTAYFSDLILRLMFQKIIAAWSALKDISIALWTLGVACLTALGWVWGLLNGYMDSKLHAMDERWKVKHEASVTSFNNSNKINDLELKYLKDDVSEIKADIKWLVRNERNKSR